MSLLNRITRGHSALQGVELVYTPHDHWPLPRSPPTTLSNTLRISVLDSSFNPPTLAHLALAKAPPHNDPYHTRLLLLSVRNADKSLKYGDATYLQRLEMMYLLAKDIDKLDENTHEGPSNVAIAIIDEPTFVGKSTALLAFLRSRLSSFSLPFSSGTPTLRLTFLLGLDTLERLFSPRYYPSEESMLKSLRYFFGPDEGSSIVCARRDPSSYPSSPPLTTGTEEPRIPQTATEFILANQITLIDIGVDEQAFSSAQVRRLRSSSDEWKKMASGRIGKYIEENGMYLE